MASVLYLALLLSLSCVLWNGADAECSRPPTPRPTIRTPAPTARTLPPTARTLPPTARTLPPTARTLPPTARTLPPTARTLPPTARTLPPTARTLPPATRRLPPPSCPFGWTKYGNRCFLFQNAQRDWVSAERACTGLGAHLASIHSISEHRFLKDLVYSNKRSFARTWVGGHDRYKEGVWLWTDGSMFTYNHWGRGEPNNSGRNEHCMEINLKGSTMYLNDERCSRNNFFICAKRV